MTTLPDRAVCSQAVAARDARFDGVFFVGIVTTGIYCRPVCPSRVARDENRRFYATAARAEAAGFRPCLRCRPELAPGRAPCDATATLAQAAAGRIAAGALNEGSVADLASGLGVTARHLRRTLQREVGVAPLDLAQTHRLLLAKQLLADTGLSVTQVAYAAGFQSLRRFHAAWRDRYGLCPTTLRRGTSPGPRPPGASDDAVRLSLAYRAPLAWDDLLDTLHRRRLPGVEAIQGARYLRTAQIGAHAGTVVVAPSARTRRTGPALDVDVSLSLLPALVPLLAGLRRLFDLDAEPAVIDAALACGGLAEAVRQRPGLRAPGALDGFEVAFAVLLTDPGADPDDRPLAACVVDALGSPTETTHPTLTHHAPSARRVAEVGANALSALGVPPPQAEALATVAHAVATGTLRLEPGAEPEATRTSLRAFGVGDAPTAEILARALSWPDAFPEADPADDRADAWRPWRAYAVHHLARRVSTGQVPDERRGRAVAKLLISRNSRSAPHRPAPK